ncbi:hypothetical protein, partial [Thermococcus sp. M36]|uniref:hypothetical protein n=1 Tax=Thermococcus sp. M36 TaxID=1638261 RepID=UPI00197FBE28
MDLQLTPYVSAGQFKIGALKKNINEVLGSDFEFYSYSYSSDVTDHYKKHGLQFDYDNGNICISIQIEKPSFAFYRN